MLPRNPRPNVSDGVITCLAITVIGAPEVLGPHIPHWAGQMMFWGGIGSAILYVAWRWGAWAFGLGTKTEKVAPSVDTGGGAYVGHDVGRDVYSGGTVNVYHAPTSQQPEPPKPRIERDTKLGEAIKYAVTKDWDAPPLLEHPLGAIRQAGSELEKFHQLAADGRLQVWALNHNSTVYEPIPPQYWFKHSVAYTSLHRDQTKMEFDTLPLPPYRDHMVSKIQVEALWPKAPIARGSLVNWAPWRLRTNYSAYEFAAILAGTDPGLDMNQHGIRAFLNVILEHIKSGNLEILPQGDPPREYRIPREAALAWAKVNKLPVGWIE
jgi:hypothetical protein